MDEYLPHSYEAERGVICKLIVCPNEIDTVGDIICKDDFCDSNLGNIFEAIIELKDENREIGMVAINDRLKSKNKLPFCEEGTYLGNLLAITDYSDNAESLSQTVSEYSVKRQLIRESKGFIEAIEGSKGDTVDVLGNFQNNTNNIVSKNIKTDIYPLSTIIADIISQTQQASVEKKYVTGIQSGFPQLDIATAGFQPSDFILIAARPSMGKTALVLNIARHIAFTKNQKVLLFSLEMSKEQIGRRLLSLESGVGAQEIRIGDIKDDEWIKLSASNAETIKPNEGNLIIIDNAGSSLNEIKSECRKQAKHGNIDIIIIDYLQLMSVKGKTDNRVQEISEISRGLKMLARELNVPIIALSQLSRAVEQRQDHRPQLSDLRESGAIEQDADVVMFLYREDYYNKDKENAVMTNEADLSIAKQRNGPLANIKLLWMPKYTKFVNVERIKEG